MYILGGSDIVFENLNDFSYLGKYDLIVTYTDNHLTASPVTFTVNILNTAPIFTQTFED